MVGAKARTQERRTIPVSSGSRTNLLCRDYVSCLSSKNKHSSGGGISCQMRTISASTFKACVQGMNATQSDSCASPPCTFPLRAGCHSLNPGAGLAFITATLAAVVMSEGLGFEALSARESLGPLQRFRGLPRVRSMCLQAVGDGDCANIRRPGHFWRPPEYSSND